MADVDTKSNRERREYFRVNYLENKGPVLTVFSNNYRVQDISERGLRFQKSWLGRYVYDQIVRGVLTFGDGEKIQIVGSVVRVTTNDVALLLSKRIPYQRILTEQMNLRRTMS